MTKRALILYPEIPSTYWSFKHAISFQGKDSAFPPLGALTIASFFPYDWEVRLVDQNVKKLRDKELKNSDFVFISAMTVQEPSVVEDIERARRLNKKIILGGPFVSTHLPATKLADHRVEGEAETVMPTLLEDLVNGTAREHYKADARPSLDNVPLPRLDLIDLGRYSSMSVQFSRGCPFDCEFCDITKIYGRVPRVKPIDKFLAELDQLYKAGWKGSVFIVDDNFIGNLPAIRKNLPLITQWQTERDYPFNLLTEASANLPDDVLEEMVKSGFRKVFIGIETPVEASLRETHKTQNTRYNLLEKVKQIQRKGIEVMAGFIMGFDNDPPNIAELQEKFIKESGIPSAMLGLLTAIPGTGLYKRLESEGRILDNGTGNNTDGTLNFIPRLDKDRLVSSYKSLMQRLYSSNEFYGRALTFLERAKEATKIGYDHLSLSDIKAGLKSVFIQGIFDQDRRQYWRYVKEVLKDHRDRIAEGITLAIMGHHFRKVTAQYLS